MVVRKLASFVVCLFCLAVNLASAQSEARIRIVVNSIDGVEDDLKWLIEMSPTATLQKQWKPLKSDVLEAFEQGVDLKKPIALDLVFPKSELSYLARIPIAQFDGKNGFKEGLVGMGYKVKEVSAGSALYEIAEPKKKPFFLRYDKQRGYGWMATLKSDVAGNPADPLKDLQTLLGLKKDVVAEIKNDADGVTKRRDNFLALRKEFEALIKYRRNEEQNAFEMRKLALTQQLDEAERFLVETDHALVSWSTTREAPFGRGELSLTALPGTDLEKSIQDFAQKPSYFANVELHKEPLAVGRITFPLDAMRVKHVKDFYKLVRPTLDSEISKRQGKSDEQKAATKQATNKFIDMLEAGVELRVVDAFADAHAVSQGKNVFVCGIRVADGKVADEIIKLLPKMQPEWAPKPDAHEHGGVSIHELTVPKSRLASFQRIFPGETVLYVGTSKEAVWGAAGTDAIKHLSAAIDQVAKPAPEKADPVSVKYQIELAKLVTLMEIIEKEAPIGNTPLSKEQEAQKKEIERFRKLAQDSMGTCNSLLHGELKRVDNKIEGFIEVNDCVLKFIGTVIADKVKDALQ